MVSEVVTEQPPQLRVRNLQVEFRTRAGIVRAVDDVSFDLRTGGTLAILGESGSGKSVTALSLMGLIPKPAGRIAGGVIEYDGVDLVQESAAVWRKLRGEQISMVFQDPLSSLNPVFRVGYQIGEMARRHRGASRREARELAIELMTRVGIPDARKRVDDFPHQFSGGMRQRVMIAMALSLEPRLLIADEPTTALDVTVQAQILELLADLQHEHGMSLILITHDLGVVADVAEDVCVMYAGRVVESGSLQEVYRRHAHPYTRGLMRSIPRLDAKQNRLTPVRGLPPDPLRLPHGCSFAPRCDLARDYCEQHDPDLVAVPGSGGAHQSACHFMEEVLPDREAASDA
jgi:oligopeptide transport system ATP-binding protein